MHDFWTIPPPDMRYTRLQNYTNMMVGEYEIQTFEVVVVVLLLPGSGRFIGDLNDMHGSL